MIKSLEGTRLTAIETGSDREYDYVDYDIVRNTRGKTVRIASVTIYGNGNLLISYGMQPGEYGLGNLKARGVLKDWLWTNYNLIGHIPYEFC